MSDATDSAPARDSARSYHRWQFWIGVSEYLISATYLGALLVTGLSTHLRDVLAGWTSHWWLAVLVAVLVIGLGQQLLILPSLSLEASGCLVATGFITRASPGGPWIASRPR